MNATPLPKAPPPVRAELPLEPENILLRAQVVCGELARDVRLIPQPDHTLLVKVLVSDARLQTLVRNKLMRLSEMESPAIRLSIVVEP
jgi:hypothetical protein